MFKCDMCGMCCRSLGGVPLYNDLNRGDGICKYLDEELNLCKIYEERPLKCNVDKFYDEYLNQVLTIDEYYEINYKECRDLKKRGK